MVGFNWKATETPGLLEQLKCGNIWECSPSVTTAQKVMLTVWSWLVPGINAQQNLNEDIPQTILSNIPLKNIASEKSWLEGPIFFLLGLFGIPSFQLLTFCWHLSSFSSTRSFSNSSLSWSSRNGLPMKNVRSLGNDTFHQEYQHLIRELAVRILPFSSLVGVPKPYVLRFWDVLGNPNIC